MVKEELCLMMRMRRNGGKKTRRSLLTVTCFDSIKLLIFLIQ